MASIEMERYVDELEHIACTRSPGRQLKITSQFSMHLFELQAQVVALKESKFTEPQLPKLCK